MSLDTLVSQLTAVHGTSLTAVVLYGSGAGGEAVTGRSDLNVMTLVETLSLQTLRSLGQTMRAWSEAGQPPVLVFTTEEWRTSADIFPMEYADILEQHRVLHGALPLDGLVVHLANLRLQVEREAMGKLLRLRRSIMVAGTDRDRQQELLRASLSTLLVIFRAVLRLHGTVPPRDADAVISAVATHAGFDAHPYLRVVALRRGTALDASDTETVLQGYLAGMTTLVAYLDRFVPPATASDIHPLAFS
jgi:hypothetical protein